MRRLGHWFAQRPIFASLVIVVAVVAPGYWRTEQAIDDAHAAAVKAEETAQQAKETATTLTQLLLQIEQDRLTRRQELCQRDVADRLDDRALWEEAFILFEGAPEVAQLRETLDDRLPLLECGVDGVPVPKD